MGYRVLCVDNLITGSEQNIRHLTGNQDFQFIRFDVTNQMSGIYDVEYVFHLASPASVIDYQKYPEETALVNSTGTYLLLKLAKAAQARFLYTSTSEVYGDPKEHPQTETYWGNVNPNGIRSCYDESKRYGEMLTMLYFRKFNVDARIVRIFNTYGPRMRKTDGRVVSNFINQSLEGKPITVYGNGKQTRSFCYVSDMVEGIIRTMFSERTKGEVINLGNPEELTVMDLAKQVQEMTRSKSEIVFSDLPEDDPVVRRPDIGKAGRLLSWKPAVGIKEGLSSTIEYYRRLQ
jgi:nucleoside-diphosphate-sugar epimerase